jgi:hypothetical protein
MRDADALRIGLRFVNLLEQHPANTAGHAVTVGSCTLVLHGVHVEEARLFDDANREWRVHTDPRAPLEAEIVDAHREPAGTAWRYRFSGMHRAGWSEWDIVAEGFTLVWKEVLGSAWFVKE